MAKILTLLVLLMTAVTGAWAQEQSETIATTANTVEGTHFTISNDFKFADGYGMTAYDDGITVTSKNGETITKVVISCTYDPEGVNDGNTSVSSGTKEITNGGGTITVTGVNASTFTFTCSDGGPQFGQFVVYYTEAPAGPEVTWNATTKTGTFAMPAYDVELEVEYYPGMLTLPAASEGGTVTLESVTISTIIDENFDDYTVGGKMAQTANAAGNSYWTTWSNAPGSGEDGTLATLNDNTCLQVIKDNDQVLLLGDKTSGMWEYSFDVYVPEGKFGYFNLLHNFDGNDSSWAFQCYLNANWEYDGENTSITYSPGHGTVHAGSASTADLPCVVNEWMHVSIVIDIDNDLAKLFFNGDFICEWQWSLESYGEDVVGGKLAACNFFGEGDEYYVDNIKFTQISALPAGFERDGYGNIYVESGTQINLVATPAENYHLASLSDGTNTYDVDDDGKVTITMPDADLTLTAEFAENTYAVTFAEGTNPDPEHPEWTATPNPAKTKQTVTVTYSGTKKVIGVKAEKKAAAPAAPTLDLATVTEATTVEDGYTLTGTPGANVKISIADGATVTLDGVTINGANDPSCKWAGITCLGDATIILSGTNTVKGFYDEYPGIYVPQNKTVTIEGSGSLTASSNGMGCGIGGGFQIACGNIVIAGGTITATGGEYAAGIGGGYSGGSCGTISITGGTVTANGGQNGAGIGGGSEGSCGNISITGGTINATGNKYGAGIGSGSDGSCGTITITNGVTSLTATKGGYAPYSIGAGDSGQCGKVTIGGTEGQVSQSPYTYQPSN